MLNNRIFSIIDGYAVDKPTKMLFKKMYLIYYHNVEFSIFKDIHAWTKCYTYLSLSFIDKLRLYVDFNLMAFLLGPFYYITHKMPKKGWILLGIIIVLFKLDSFYAPAIPLIFLYCGLYANRDYFLYNIQVDDKIKGNPDVLVSQVDENMYSQILSQSKVQILLPLISVILQIGLIYLFGINTWKEIEFRTTLNSIPQVCKDNYACETYISEKEMLPSAKKDVRTYYNLGCAYTLINNDRKAQENFFTATIKDKNYVRTYITRGNIYFKQEKYLESIADYKTALKIDPKLNELNYNIGRNYYRLGKYSEAVLYFDRAIKGNPRDPKFYEMRAYSKIYLRNVAGAKKDLREAIKIYGLQSYMPGSNAGARKASLEKYYRSLR
ncbi:tetratricopeptide repeat protein [bacterium]|nr:tetratricopeptide repeat protein [bacterium]